MTQTEMTDQNDAAPGAEETNVAESGSGFRGYLIGYVLALLLTGASFYAAQSNFIYAPAIISALVVLAIAQMGVHLVFFLHITTGPDNTNNVIALAFGVLIVGLVVLGSIWIMGHLHENMTVHENMSRKQMLQMNR